MTEAFVDRSTVVGGGIKFHIYRRRPPSPDRSKHTLERWSAMSLGHPNPATEADRRPPLDAEIELGWRNRVVFRLHVNPQEERLLTNQMTIASQRLTPSLIIVGWAQH
jgi:hypothetical protein